ncbi:MAG: RluA family pseudouridine synthase [Clostridiales bacterium]|nr:RluA family pseudouridine synthase [Clostridiales bacterium]
MEWNIEEAHKLKRLDMFLLEKFPDKTRSHIKKWIEEGVALVGGKTVKAGYSLKVGDVVYLGEVVEQVASAEPQDIPIDIVYEDDDMAIVNKEQGMVVHPAIKNYDNTLVNALMFKLKNLSSINGVIRPGIVHRLDKDTSGLLVIAKNDDAHVKLSEQIAKKDCRRIYWALVDGVVKSDGEVKTNIGRDPRNRLKMAVVEDGKGKTAHTLYRVLEVFDKYTLVEFELKTGRTHQIRVHSTHLHHPIVGDKLYNNNPCKFKLQGQLLHAKRLILTHPKTGDIMEFDSDLPDYFMNVLNALRNNVK